jgi:hypothetical protein
MDKQTDRRIELLKSAKEKATQKIYSAMAADNEFLNAISQGTGDVGKVQLRFARFGRMIEEALP